MEDLILKWNIPDSPTGSIFDLFYELRIGGEESIPDTADTYLLTNVSTDVSQVCVNW